MRDDLMTGCAMPALISETACGCRRCLAERDERVEIAPGFSVSAVGARMILCPICGNKRCPHATDHRHACTGSNEPGQPGSVYA